MLEKLCEFKNKSSVVFVPKYDLKYYDSIKFTFGNVIKLDNDVGNSEVIKTLNESKIKKIYLFGYHDLYRYFLPRLTKKFEVCWIYNDSFSNLSNGDVRYNLSTIFEYYERKLIKSIGCLSVDNRKVFENAGYKCEYIDLKIRTVRSKVVSSKSIGILSDDYDPNNNFYNQLASLTFVDYDVCKFKSCMASTTHFCKYFGIKSKVFDNIDIILKDNFVNLYINFTNTNKELILKSYNNGVPVIVGNTDFYDNNEYLKTNLVVKSDDDINEIVDKINFVKKNYKNIMAEYNKIR